MSIQEIYPLHVVGIGQAEAGHLDEQKVGYAVQQVFQQLGQGAEPVKHRPDPDRDHEGHKVLGEDGGVLVGEKAQVLVGRGGRRPPAEDGLCHQEAGEHEKELHADGAVREEGEMHPVLQGGLP